MPPHLDVYGLTRQRDRRTVNQFLNRFVDRPRASDRRGEELMVLREDASPGVEQAIEVEWVPITSLEEALALGLASPPLAFALYLAPSGPGYAQAMLGFTRDGQLVLGLSVDDPEEAPAALVAAERALQELIGEFGCHLGVIGVELPPPLSEGVFAAAVATSRLVAYDGRVNAPPV